MKNYETTTFLNLIRPNILDKNNKISSSRLLWFFRKNDELKNQLFLLTPNCTGIENFMERIFWIENDLSSYLICANPACNAKLRGITYWSVSKENIEWHKNNHRLTCSNACKHNLHSSRKIEVHRKRIKAMNDNYGVDNPAHLESNLFKKDNPMKKANTIRKVKDTCLKKFGVDNPSKCSQVMNKIIKKGYGSKDYIFPSGKLVRIRGYEWKALNELLKIYDENDIEVETTKIPKIKYFWEDGSSHYYFPDIFIKKDNLLIEVKSDYYMLKDFEKNMRKAVATKQLGYDFRFIVYDK